MNIDFIRRKAARTEKKEGTRAGRLSLGGSNLPASAPSLAAKGEFKFKKTYKILSILIRAPQREVSGRLGLASRQFDRGGRALANLFGAGCRDKN